MAEFRILKCAALALALLACVGFVAPADAYYGGSKKSGGPRPELEKPPAAAIVFSEIERQLIGDYFRDHPVAPDPNVLDSTTGALPPGIQKKLARGGLLPPGIARRPLPNDLDAKLPPREGVTRVILGEDVLLIRAGTVIILDILEGVLRGGQR
jgi:hypothetical protein